MDGPSNTVDKHVLSVGQASIRTARPKLPILSIISSEFNHDGGKIQQVTQEGRDYCGVLINQDKKMNPNIISCIGETLENSSSNGVVPSLKVHGKMKITSASNVGNSSQSVAVRSESEIVETMLESSCITGFEVGGEVRICLPHIITSVLSEFSADQIFAVCTTLNIFLAPCNEAQLQALKHAGILPAETRRSGLITKTDAERMCNTLLPRDKNSRVAEFEREWNVEVRYAFIVFHECFGGCRGEMVLERYTHPRARCIICRECGTAFNPFQFVGHCHSDPERRACHWGFDPVHWRSYLMLAAEHPGNQQDRNTLEAVLNDLKNKFIDTENIQQVFSIFWTRLIRYAYFDIFASDLFCFICNLKVVSHNLILHT